ncbi:NUDIX hydrolase [Cryobacterium psychrophilum]|uniref:NUDIX domain-containing protein n=1 Tax=Cryobacterium psychrophilum TaxID=41988 RepID=A0A4Y8KPT6_9MICO|nr:NUDIX domain-containing protein [Cryobacterium psychrophilum]TDW30480.1 ADP-ribose pyrophosphatase YjhB (NUDIX family) [Cryobacterium psychrophilum]TFD79553.1 NUDIX domain-containing protein [Cryobacterium psychrophilum]
MGSLAVSAVVRDPAGRYLLVLRSASPERGRWTLPGGRVEPGETLHDALVREVREETGLGVRVVAEVGTLERAAPDGTLFEIHCFTTEPLDGVFAAGSDAAGLRWATAGELRTLNVTRGLLDSLRQWHQL